ILTVNEVPGGIDGVISTARESGILKPYSPAESGFLSFDPTVRITLWSGLIGVGVAFLTRYGADQMIVQRYLTAKNMKNATRGFWLNVAAVVVSLLLLFFFGLAVKAYSVHVRGEALDLLGSGRSAMELNKFAMQQLALVIKSLPYGVAGLVTAGLMAATMSSIDSGINACSGAYITDFHYTYFPSAEEGAGERRSCPVLRFRLALAFGILSTILALVFIPVFGGRESIFALVNKIIHGLGSPLLALMLCGFLTRKLNAAGAFAGGTAGILWSIYVCFFIKGIAMHYYAALTFAGTVILIAAASLIAKLAGAGVNEEQQEWTAAAILKRAEKGGEEE
ncbi:MAG: hypothetical protein JXR97_13835, partial [Planctomycetes bacterium]|nr:hypothetical protein [Planctomycetota bacterium]